jgi:hypothetical protein
MNGMKRPLAFQSAGLIAVLSYACAFFALPIRTIGGVFLSPPSACHAAGMTVGCAKGTCCTDKCYLDENGLHHCVHEENQSCDCGLSSNAKASDSVLVIQAATLVVPGEVVPASSSVMRSEEFPGVLHEPASSIPTPPPRSRQ